MDKMGKRPPRSMTPKEIEYAECVSEFYGNPERYTITRLIEHVETQDYRIQLLTDVLGWYASEGTYIEKESIHHGHKLGENIWRMIDNDRGEYAQNILRGVEDKGEENESNL